MNRMNDAEQVAIMQARQKEEQMARVRNSALTLAEYQHRDEPAVKALADEVAGAQQEIDLLREKVTQAQRVFVAARQKLESHLEKHIPEELRILTGR